MYSWPSQTNTYIPSWESTHTLISFTRDPKNFKVASYTEYKDTKKRDAYYLKLDLDQPARVIDDSLFGWADGAEAPRGEYNVGGFIWTEFRTKRRAFPYTLGYQAVDQADWEIENQNSGIVMQQAMTLRTIRVQTLLQTSSNWPASNTADANVLNGGAGKWDTASDDPSSAYYLAIKKSVLAAGNAIKLQTNSVVHFRDMYIVISPGMARRMACTSEIHDYIKQPEGIRMLKGDKGVFGEYGLPEEFYSYNIVVEDAVKVTSNISTVGGAATRSFAFQDNNPIITSKPGMLKAQYGGSSYSTVQIYFYEEMTVETKSDPDNRRHNGRVVEDYSEQLAAGPSGYSITNAL